MNILSKKILVSDDVDLQSLAKRTDGFTGADLQALVYNAHLLATNDLLMSQSKSLSLTSENVADCDIICLNENSGMRSKAEQASKMRTVPMFVDLIMVTWYRL